MAEIVQLTEMQYSSERQGPFALYIYNSDGLHHGARYFRNRVRYPDEEITTKMAKVLVEKAVFEKAQVRICDSGDKLVFWARYGKLIWPEDAAKFWEELEKA